MHCLRQICITRLKHQMDMIAHENEGINFQIESLTTAFEELAEMFVIFVLPEYPLPLITTHANMIMGTGILDSKRP